MATMMEQYLSAKQAFSEQIAANSLPLDKLLAYQELIYRIGVIETCRDFCRTAPRTMDVKALGFHYRVVEGYLMNLMMEHYVGKPADEKLKGQRETARNNLQGITASFRKQFSSFQASNPDHYHQAITNMVNTVLPAWVKFRDTYTTI